MGWGGDGASCRGSQQGQVLCVTAGGAPHHGCLLPRCPLEVPSLGSVVLMAVGLGRDAGALPALRDVVGAFPVPADGLEQICTEGRGDGAPICVCWVIGWGTPQGASQSQVESWDTRDPKRGPAALCPVQRIPRKTPPRCQKPH